MRVAQQLYEGVDTGDGAAGLITYMRTDSTTLGADAVAELREYIASTFGADNVPREARIFRTRAKNAQEAHEAVRPTSAARTPESLAKVLASDQAKLYELIWKRTVACQMRHATINTVAVEFTCGAEPRPDTPVPDDLLRATGSTVAVPGFLAVYEEGLDDKKAEKERRIPPLEKGAAIKLKALRPEQHFTEPPPRYSEATLIRVLEDYGIGRPSTYASIISTLQQREYAELENRRFRPTDVGRLVNAFVTEHFADYVDYDFTARLEDDLDAVSRGEREWVPLLEQFWKPFHQKVSEKEVSVTRTEASQTRVLGTDLESDRPVSVRVGRYGPYAQIGSAGDEDKPRFASLRRDQRVNTITIEEAIALFELPRELGTTPAGEPVQTNIGRFGPYVKYGSKFVSLNPDDDPHTLDLARAIEIIADKKRVDAQRQIKEFEGGAIRILNGRYGPYLTDGKKNARVPKGRDPALIELDEAKRLIEAAPLRRARRRRNS
jgi:DNA topoisomerase-1